MANATVANERRGTGCGYGQVYSALVTLDATASTTAVTVPTGLTTIGHARATWADALGAGTTESDITLVATGGVLSIDTTADLGGSKKIYLQAFGD
jgi:hypothetical protein